MLRRQTCAAEKPGGKRAGIGAFKDGESAARAASGAAYAAGVQQENAVRRRVEGDVRMPKKRSLGPCVTGGGGNGLAAFFHTVTAAMRQEKPAYGGVTAGDFQHLAFGVGRLIIPVAADDVPGQGKACRGRTDSHIRKTIAQKNCRVKGESANLRPPENRCQGRPVAVGIGNNQKKSAV